MLKRILFLVIRITGLNALYGYFSNPDIFIIGYHSVAGAYLKVTIDKDLFEKQICFLAEHGHTSIQFAGLKNLNKAILKPTIIYFDDGFKDNLTIAAPILKKYNFTATIFVVPAHADKPEDLYLTWNEVRQLDEQGFEIGSHTAHHVKLTEIGVEEAKEELVSSKAIIEKEIGKPVTAFSYPKGGVNKEIAAMVREAGYEYAITTRYGTNSVHDLIKRPHMLRKVAPRVYESMEEFKVRLYAANVFYNHFL